MKTVPRRVKPKRAYPKSLAPEAILPAAVSPTNPAAAFKDPLLRLLRRTSYGLTPSQVATARQMGFTAYLEYQLNPAGIDDSLMNAELTRSYPLLFKTPYQLASLDDGQVYEQLVRSTIWRRAFSERQLFERMVEFWSDHFNVYIEKVGSALQAVHDRDVIRKFALDTFPNLLRATAHSPAMLVMLDNDPNSGAFPNQNYGRELMELHTLGVGGGYTQEDVINVSRCFTGWSYHWDQTQTNFGTFVFNEDDHFEGLKTVLQHHFMTGMNGGGGQQDGEIVLNILAAHPSTALHIATKLAKWLLDYNPSPVLVQQIANVYLQTGGDIKSMLRAILTPSNLMAAGAKYKRPNHLFISTLRALNPTVSDLGSLEYDYLGIVADLPFEWAPPNGYPDVMGFWAGYILPRWNFMLNLMSDGVNGMLVDINELAGTATDMNSLVQRISTLVFAGEMLPDDPVELVRFLRTQPVNEDHIRAAFAIALACPSFQWY